MSVRLLVAAAENDVIGRDGQLPWHLPADLRRFAALTRGHVVVMGRLTHESIIERLSRPLPGRHSIVLSRGARNSLFPDVDVVGSPAQACDLAEELSSERGLPDWFVIGGAQVFAQLLPVVDVIDLTRVLAPVDGDVRMPVGWLDGFVCTSEQPGVDEVTGLPYSFLRLERTAGR